MAPRRLAVDKIAASTSRKLESAMKEQHLGALARLTRRYSICTCRTGSFKVFDNRYLLDNLLRWPGVLPFDEVTGIFEFNELRVNLSAGPTLNEADHEVLSWLGTNAEAISYDEEEAAKRFTKIFRAATVSEGDVHAVERFLRAVVHH